MRLLACVLFLLTIGQLASAATRPRSIHVGAGPCGIAAGFGFVWVASDRAGTVSRINPRTNAVRTVRVGRSACWLAVGAGAVWTARYGAGRLVRLDPHTLRTSAIKVGPNPEGVAVAAGSVWVTGFDNGTVTKVDPKRRRVVQTLHLGGVTAGLAVARGALWVGFGREATSIARIDLRTGETRRVEVGHKTPDRLATDGRALWVSAQDTVIRIDLKTERVVGRFPRGGTFAQGTLASDRKIWIPNKERNTITRFDPVTNRAVSSIGAGPGAIAAAAGFGSVWVSSYVGSDVRRFIAH